jgi:hypothetical protein
MLSEKTAEKCALIPSGSHSAPLFLAFYTSNCCTSSFIALLTAIVQKILQCMIVVDTRETLLGGPPVIASGLPLLGGGGEGGGGEGNCRVFTADLKGRIF